MIIIMIAMMITFTLQAIWVILGLCLGCKLLLLLLFLPGDHHDGDRVMVAIMIILMMMRQWKGWCWGPPFGRNSQKISLFYLMAPLMMMMTGINTAITRSVFWSTIIFGSMKMIKMLRVSTEVSSFYFITIRIKIMIIKMIRLQLWYLDNHDNHHHSPAFLKLVLYP